MYNKFKRHKQVRLMRLSFERYFSYHLRIKSRNVVSFNILAHGVLITSSCPWLWTLLWTLNRQAKIFLRKEHGFLYIQKTINLQVICGVIKLLRSHKITKISTPPPLPLVHIYSTLVTPSLLRTFKILHHPLFPLPSLINT